MIINFQKASLAGFHNSPPLWLQKNAVFTTWKISAVCRIIHQFVWCFTTAEKNNSGRHLRRALTFNPCGRVCVTYLCPGAAASVSVDVVQAEDLEGGERRGSRLGGDHPSEPSHRPRPHVVVVRTNWQTTDRNNFTNTKNKLDWRGGKTWPDQFAVGLNCGVSRTPTWDEVFLREHDLGDGAAVDREGLEELRPRADRLRMLNDDSNRPRAGPIRDLDPVPAVTWSHDQNISGSGLTLTLCGRFERQVL